MCVKFYCKKTKMKTETEMDKSIYQPDKWFLLFLLKCEPNQCIESTLSRLWVNPESTLCRHHLPDLVWVNSASLKPALRILFQTSSICRAALHTGVLKASGGYVDILVMDKKNSYTGSLKNGIQSERYLPLIYSSEISPHLCPWHTSGFRVITRGWTTHTNL